MSTTPRPYAIFAEYGTSNKKMDKGANRRVFNTVLADSGGGIRLEEDGAIVVPPGTWRIDGYSIVGGSNLDVVPAGNTWPGYCVVTDARYEADREKLLANAIAVGSVAMGLYLGPSLFDGVRTFTEEVRIRVLHQAGDDVEGLFLTYIDGDPSGPSATRLYAKIAVFAV